MVDENSMDDTGDDAVLARMKLSSMQEASGRRKLTPAARRALAEAEERRKARAAETAALPKEVNGRDGPEPVRYGDWEKNGIISDF